MISRFTENCFIICFIIFYRRCLVSLKIVFVFFFFSIFSFSKQKLLGVTPYIKWGSNVATNRYYKVGLNNDCDQCQFKRIS